MHRTFFCSGDFKFQDNIHIGDIANISGWRSIAIGIEQCPIGLKITRENLDRIHPDLKMIVEELTAIFSVDDKKQTIRISVGDKRQIDKRLLINHISRVGNEEIRNFSGRNKCPRCGWPDTK